MQTLACCEPAHRHMSQSFLASAFSALPQLPIRTSLVLAQASSDLKDKFGYGLGIIFLVGFIWGVINIWSGADKLKRGDTEGKMGIVSGIIIAGGAAIMGAFFAIFGLSDGSLTPKF